ncbi:MAG: restriction endonuclease subunit S [Aminivibrio sp.]|jgi:type I restriction enzyme S subunit
MKQTLSHLCNYVDERVAVADLDLDTYISTENMLPNKEGVVRSAGLPSVNRTQAYKTEDVLVSNIRPYFRKIWFADRDGGCSNDVLVLRSKENCNPRFLYYLLSDNNFFDYATATAKGTKMPRGDKVAIMRYAVPDVPIDTQIIIADTLSVLDARIAGNKKINHHLEQMAQAIFKSWFVDFESFGGEQPSEWQNGNLTEIADYTNGLTMQRFRPAVGEVGLPVLKIKELRQGSCDSLSELCSPNIHSNYVVNDGDVIFSWSGSLLVDFWCGGDCGLNQHLFKVTSRKYDKWFYYVWTHHHLGQFIAMAADKATTMGHIKREALEKAKVIIPDEVSYRQIGGLLAPLYEQVINNRIENRKLSQLRDSLLPKLITGEISEEMAFDE